MTHDEIIQDLTIRLATIEELLLHLAAFIAERTGEPAEFAQTLMDDLRGNYAAASGGTDPGLEAFIKRSCAHTNELEVRLRRLLTLESQ